MTVNSINELTGASYIALTRLLRGNKKLLTDSTFISDLERSLPSIHWDLKYEHISALLYGASRFPSKAGQTYRSLCVRLSDLCRDASQEDSSVTTEKPPFVDLRNIVVLSWCLQSLSRRDANDAHLRQAAVALIPSLLHWVEECTRSLVKGGSTLEDLLPSKEYIRLVTAMICLDHVLGDAKDGSSDFTAHVSQLHTSSSHLISEILTLCCKGKEQSSLIPPSSRQNPSFEESHEAYIYGSFKALCALIRRLLPAEVPTEAYVKLLHMVDLASIRRTDLLVVTLEMLIKGKISIDHHPSLVIKLLDEIGGRNLGVLSNEQLYDLLNGCAMTSLQHAGVLEATSDAILQRSHRLPGISWVVNVMDCFRRLSYHNPSVLELMVRHINNNIKQASREQLQLAIDCCRALNYRNELTESLIEAMEGNVGNH